MADGSFNSSEKFQSKKRVSEQEELRGALRVAQSQYEQLQSLPDGVEKTLAKTKYESAQKRLELYRLEHDQSGALKSHRFGADMAAQFEKGFEPGTQFIRVSMAELDRLNTQGGHALGDKAMELTYQQIADRVEVLLQAENPEMDAKALASKYAIYRTGGNEFSVTINGSTNPGLLHELFDGLRRVDAVAEQNVEAPPLVVNHSSIEEVQEAQRVAFEALGEDRDNLDERGRRRFDVQVLMDVLNAESEIRKTKTRLDRFEELAKRGDHVVAKEVYEKFLKKGLGTIFSGEKQKAAGYEEVLEMVKQMGGFSDSWASEWAKEKEQIAFDEGWSQFSADTELERVSDQTLSTAVAKKTASNYLERLPRYGPMQQEEASFSITPTRGAIVLDRAAANTKEIQARFDLSPTATNEALLESAQLDLALERARYDTMTGLETRGQLYDRLQDGLKNNVPSSTLFIDMAFLKYFDKEGGPDVGDTAIKKAGSIIDEVLVEFLQENPDLVTQGLRANGYRYGGDEFVVNVQNATEAQVRMLEERIHARASKTRIPPGINSLYYAPEQLVFNIGTSHIESTDQLEQRLLALGLPINGEKGSDEYLNHLAEYAIKFADKEIDIAKAMDRFELLTERILEFGADSGRAKQLLTYSQKAIFGEVGQNKLMEVVQRIQEHPDQKDAILAIARQSLLQFTLEQKQGELEKKHESDRQVESKIEGIVRERYFERRIDSLTHSIRVLEQKLNEAEAENHELKAQLVRQKAIFEEEREGIVDLRKRLGGL